MRFLRHLSAAALFVWLLVLFPLFSFAQKKTTAVKSFESDVTQLNQRLAYSIHRVADSTLQLEQRYSDSLISALAFTANKAMTRINLVTDSLITSAHDSLDALRRDTLRFVAKSLQQ